MRMFSDPISGAKLGIAPLIVGVLALSACGGSAKSASQPTTGTHLSNLTASSTATAPAPAGSASTLPAPTKADAKFLEHVVLGSITECLNIAVANNAEVAHATIAKQVDELIALFRRVNPDATIPYGKGRHVTVRQDVASTIKRLKEKPAAPASAAPCASQLAQRLSEATGVH